MKPIVAMVDATRSSSSTTPTSIISLSDPCSGDARQYLTHKPRKTNSSADIAPDQSLIYEMQSLQHPRSDTYSSFFVNSRVISNPKMHLVTPVDPLYFILPFFENEEKWQPWNQIVEAKGISSEIVQRIDTAQLKHLFLVNDSYGDDMILYKFKRERGLDWLKKKMNRVEEFLKIQFLLQEKRAEADEEQGGAFSASFHLSSSGHEDVSKEKGTPSATRTANHLGNDEITLTSSQKNLVKQSAAQVICEYLSDYWQLEFLQSMSLARGNLSKRFQEKSAASTPNPVEKSLNTSAEVSPTSSASGLKRPFSEPQISEADKLLQYTMGNDDGESPDRKNEKKRKEAAKSVALKRLSKVNTKGMKSMTSFFCAKPKKND